MTAMPAAPPHRITRSASDRICIKLTGHLDLTVAEGIEREVTERSGELFPRSSKTSVLIDMEELTSCDVAARSSLVRVQKILRASAARTAVFAGRPRIRGLALWVAHVADEPNARPLPTLGAALAWLDATATRLEDARRRTDRFLNTGTSRAPSVLDRLRPRAVDVMNRRRELSRGDRAGAMMLKLATRLAEGYWLPFTDELIRMFGLRGTLEELTRYRRVTAALEGFYGECDAYLLLGFAALWNGCGYASVGHIFASNLIRYRDEGVLFPIDQDEAEGLQHMTDDRAMARVREILHEPRYARTLGLLERQFALKLGTADGETPHDAWLLGCIAALDLTNEYSILAGLDADPHAVPPLAHVAKHHELRHRYEAARQAQRRQRVESP